MTQDELKEFLEEKYVLYNSLAFIETDPIRIPHQFTKKNDIEIAAFLTATIAWGQRKAIILNAKRMMDLMDNQPYDFVMSASKEELKLLNTFCHRTFNGVDLCFFVKALRNIYEHKGGLSSVFLEGYSADNTIYSAIRHFRRVFFALEHPLRTEKHVSNVEKGASAKRLNMFLRWMIRKDKGGVDFGIWNNIPTSALMLPLDVHTGNVSRKLGLLTRKQNDWKTLDELMRNLRKFDSIDPVKYDFALFGLGVFEKF